MSKMKLFIEIAAIIFSGLCFSQLMLFCWKVFFRFIESLDIAGQILSITGWFAALSLVGAGIACVLVGGQSR